MSDSARARYLSNPCDDALAELESAADDFVAIDEQPCDAVTIERDESGLAFLVEVRRD